ncbi:hypothetical protein JCM11251_004961 [Rhodosporidiobolus azoricus]
MGLEATRDISQISPTASVALTDHLRLPSCSPTSSPDLANLSTRQLALSWVTTNAAQWDSRDPTPIFEEMRAKMKRYEDGGSIADSEGDELFSRIGLEWYIPTNLDELVPDQLALLPLHSSFDDSLIEPARAIFRARQRGLNPRQVPHASSPMTADEAVACLSPVAPPEAHETHEAREACKTDLAAEHDAEAPMYQAGSSALNRSACKEIDPVPTLVYAEMGTAPATTGDQAIDGVDRNELDANVTVAVSNADDKSLKEQAVQTFLDGLEVEFESAKAMKAATPASADPSACKVSMRSPIPPFERLPHQGPSVVEQGKGLAHAFEQEPNPSHSPKGRQNEKKRMKNHPTPYLRRSHVSPLDNTASLVPSSLTRTWTTIFVSNLSTALSHAQVWDLLSSPPRLPQPVAIRLVRASQTKWWLCFVAYATREDAHLAALAIPSIEAGTEGVYLGVTGTKKPPEAYDLAWSSMSEDYRRRYEPNTVQHPTNRPSDIGHGRFRMPSCPLSSSSARADDLPNWASSSANSPCAVEALPALPGDPVPLRLLQNCQSIFLDNLPIDVSLDELSAYLPADAVIGMSLNNPYDPTFRSYRSREPQGSAFLLFLDSNSAGDVADRAFSRRVFPGAKIRMHWQRKHKPTPWMWSEMSPSWAAANGGLRSASASTGVGNAADTSIEPAPRDAAEKQHEEEAKKNAWGRSKKLREGAESLREHFQDQSRHHNYQQQRGDHRSAAVNSSSPSHSSSSNSYSYRDTHPSYLDYQEPPPSHRLSSSSSYAEPSSSHRCDELPQLDYLFAPRYGSLPSHAHSQRYPHNSLWPSPSPSHSAHHSHSYERHEHDEPFFVDSYGGLPFPRQQQLYDGYATAPDPHSSLYSSQYHHYDANEEEEYRRERGYR